jgi:ABC-2 type transport system ATP-binding protein
MADREHALRSIRSDTIISIDHLSRQFGSKTVLNDVTLKVSRGCVLGLVGQNGAGKTTLIKHILGLLKAESGQVRVFGANPVADPVSVLGRIGYLSEQPELPEWMRVDEFMRYTQAFYPTWDHSYAQALRDQFGLNPASRLKTLSKGQRAKAALLAAQAHRPDLLLLDEPSSGLDPIVRNDILAAVIRTVAEEGRTVFFSSHLLEEIERVSDHIAMLHQGRLVLWGPLEQIKAQHRRITLQFDAPQPRVPNIPEALAITGNGREWAMTYNNSDARLPLITSRLNAKIVAETSATLSEIFIAHAGVSLEPAAGMHSNA